MTPADYAAAGFALVPIPRGSKGPNTEGWNLKENCRLPPGWAGNVGLAHAYSGTCALDLDRLDDAAKYLEARGINVAELIAASDAVRIDSGRENRAKLIYRLAEPLPSKKLANGAFELRSASAAGLTVQDVLPPSIHPETGLPYAWVGNWRSLPTIPDALLKLWLSLSRKVDPNHDKVSFTGQLDELKRLLAKHSPNAPYDADEGDSFIKVGMAIHDATDGSDEGLAIWDEFLRPGIKYAEGARHLESHWRSFKKGGITWRWLSKDTSIDASDFSQLDEYDDIVIDDDVPVTQQPEKVVGKDITVPAAGMRRKKNGRIESNILSIYAAIQQTDLIGMHVGYDDFRAEIMQVPAGRKNLDDMEPFGDEHYTDIRLALERFGFDSTGVDNVRQAVYKLAKRNRFDSARDWLNDQVADDKSRVKTFLPDYMGADDNEYNRAASVYLWTALAGRVLDPACQADIALIFYGKQGCKKSTSVAALAPRPEQFVRLSLDQDDDDLARMMAGTLVGELPELRGLASRDLESIKDFVTAKRDKWVPKYKEFATSYPRRTILVGTTNKREILGDETGERRFLPVHVHQGNPDAIRRDISLLWAEARDLYNLIGVAWQRAEELAAVETANYKISDTWDDLIADWLDGNNGSGLTWHDGKFTTAQVANGALGIDGKNINRTIDMRIAKVLMGLGFAKKRLRMNGLLRWVWSSCAV